MFRVIYLYYVTGDLGWLYFQWGSFFYSVIQPMEGVPKRSVLSLKFPGLIHATKFGQKHGSFSFQYIRAVPAKLAVF